LAPVIASQELLISQSLDPWDRIERSSKTTNPDRTIKVKDFYGIRERLYCQVLGYVKDDPNQKNDHQPTVKNAHIWPQHTEGKGLNLFNLSPLEQDNQRNMMRLHFAIEGAFDIKRLTFVGFPLPSSSSSSSSSTSSLPPVPVTLSSSSSSPLSPVSPSGSQRQLFGLRVRIMDLSLMSEPIGITGKKFSHIDGKEVEFPNNNRPYFRLLYAHYRRSLIHAEKKGWIGGEEDDSQKVSDQELLRHSLDSDYSNRISTWLRRPVGSSRGIDSLPTSKSISIPLPSSLPLSSTKLESKGSGPSSNVNDEKSCRGQGCHNNKFCNCKNKMCGNCCEKSPGGLCREHKRR